MRDSVRSRRPAPRRAATALVAAAALAALAGGCASIPSAGPVEAVSPPTAPGGAGQTCCALIVSGPKPGWTQEEVVSNFLLASASFAQNHAIARKYLTPAANRDWRPQSAVTILAKPPTVHMLSQHLVGPGDHTSTVLVTGQQIATLDRNGQYIPTGGVTPQQTFGLEQVNHRWLIASMPSGSAVVSHELLLTSSLFHAVYQPRDLYFYALRTHTLVPDPVFVPVGSPTLVSGLINEILHDSNGWLQGAVTTAFPRGASLRGVQVVTGPERTAIVDISLPAGASLAGTQEMAAQLIWTLTSSAYGPSLFQSVKLKLNGRPWPSAAGASAQDVSDYLQSLPQARSDPALYYVGADSRVWMLGSLAAHSVEVRGATGDGKLPLREIAVSPDGSRVAGVAGPAATVYTARLAARKQPGGPLAGPLLARLHGSAFSTPSWDSVGDLWVAGRAGHLHEVWVVPPGSGAPEAVSLPANLGPVTGLRIAPDGVRIALIVGSRSSAHLVIGSIASGGGAFTILRTVPLGPGLSGVISATWYDEDHLLVVSQAGTTTQLWEAPVNGDTATPLSGLAGMVSITADGPQNPLYLGLSNGRLAKSVGLDEPWTDATKGRDATYPG